VSGACVVR